MKTRLKNRGTREMLPLTRFAAQGAERCDCIHVRQLKLTAKACALYKHTAFAVHFSERT